MKRQKRDRNERAYLKGYQIGASGRSKSLCPISNGLNNPNWMRGWRDGRADNWDGYIGVAGLQVNKSLHCYHH